MNEAAISRDQADATYKKKKKEAAQRKKSISKLQHTAKKNEGELGKLEPQLFKAKQGTHPPPPPPPPLSAFLLSPPRLLF